MKLHEDLLCLGLAISLIVIVGIGVKLALVAFDAGLVMQ